MKILMLNQNSKVSEDEGINGLREAISSLVIERWISNTF